VYRRVWSKHAPGWMLVGGAYMHPYTLHMFNTCEIAMDAGRCARSCACGYAGK
jgi:hypothetical protein